MKKVTRTILLISASILIIMTSACSPDATSVPVEPVIEENAPGVDDGADVEPAMEESDSAGEIDSELAASLVETRCTECHSLSTTTNAAYDQAGWEATVARMIAKGARLNDEERALVVQYLAETYGP